jgi:hypothetical protein
MASGGGKGLATPGDDRSNEQEESKNEEEEV